MSVIVVADGRPSKAIIIPTKHIFETTAARDAYFITNPAEKTEDLFVLVGEVLYRWDSYWKKHKDAAIYGQSTLPDFYSKTETNALLDGYYTQTELDAIVATLVPHVAVPVSAVATGIAGQTAYDATHIYVCVATDTWVRAELATWV